MEEAGVTRVPQDINKRARFKPEDDGSKGCGHLSRQGENRLCGGLMHVGSASPALGPDQVAAVENTQGRDLETLEGGCSALPGLLPGFRILGRRTRPNAGFQRSPFCSQNRLGGQTCKGPIRRRSLHHFFGHHGFCFLGGSV